MDWIDIRAKDDVDKMLELVQIGGMTNMDKRDAPKSELCCPECGSKNMHKSLIYGAAEAEPALTREERNAVARWTGGVASINRVLRDQNPYPEKTRIALKSSWNIKHMPRHKHTSIDIEIELSEEDLMELAKGHIPKEMEDRWFMYFDGEFIRYYRSWTGICVYKGHVERRDGVPYIDRLIANRDPEQYGETNDEKDRLMFEMLVTEELGKDSSEIWDAIFSIDD